MRLARTSGSVLLGAGLCVRAEPGRRSSLPEAAARRAIPTTNCRQRGLPRCRSTPRAWRRWQPSRSQAKVPPDFTLDKGRERPGRVTCSHEKHRAKVENWTACHVKIVKMRRGQSGTATRAALQEGKLCGACHDGKTQIAGTVVFPIDACDRCHTR